METTVKLKLGFAALMIVSGIGVAMYPVVSNAVAQRHASSVIESYNDNVQSMDAEKIDAAKEAARRYNQQLNNAIDRDAAGEADDIGTSYVDMLDVGESLGYITIPKIDVNLPIYEGTSDDVLVKGVGHLEGSSYPLGGAGTHSVLTGHRGLAEAVYRPGQAGRGRPFLPPHHGRGAGVSGRPGQGRGAGKHRGFGNYPRRGLLHAGHLHTLCHQHPPYACARRWPWISVTGSVVIGGEALLLLLLLHRCKKREEED